MNFYCQPWKYRSQPYGDLWFGYFEEARKAGHVPDGDIELSLVHSYVRKDLLEGDRRTFSSCLKSIARGSDRNCDAHPRHLLSKR
jgi:hypothetical protein